MSIASRPYQALPVTVSSHPGSSSAAASRRMSQLQRRDTRPELAIRRQLHALGLRYRVAYPVPGQRRRTIDIAFPRLMLAVFVDGCFWHGCPTHGTSPRSNKDWWQEKLNANRARDHSTERLLADIGWSFLRFWEHEDPAVVADSVASWVAQGPVRMGKAARPRESGATNLAVRRAAKYTGS